MRYLHTMVRVTDLDQSLDFYCNKFGLAEVRRVTSEQGRFTLVFLSAPEDVEAAKANKAPANATRREDELPSVLSELPSVRPISPAEKPSVYGPHPLGTQQHLMLSHALREILELEQSCGLVAKLFEVCDRAPRCSSAQKQAFNLLIQHRGKLI